jgi:hypothetical protein
MNVKFNEQLPKTLIKFKQRGGKTMTKRMNENLLQSLLIVAAMMVAPDLVMAQAGAGGSADLAGLSTRMTGTELATVPNIISAVFYIGGTILVGAGLWKLKLHSENPGNTPLGQGVGRLAVGAGLLTVPFVSNWAVNTLSAGGAAQAYQGAGPVQ